MSKIINKVEPSKTCIDFSVGVLGSTTWGAGSDNDHQYSLIVSSAVLSNGFSYLGGTYSFYLSQNFDSTILNPCYYPLNQMLTFTPSFSFSNNNNSIIQYKWNFGDGSEEIVLVPTNSPATTMHSYNFNYASGLDLNNTYVIVSLTAIDQYQRHTRFSKVVYLKNYS